jgi:L-serine dehydratase
MISIFELFKVGIGPSSSHTVGPMKAARAFVDDLERLRLLERVGRVEATLFGSLAFTGRGHGSDKAVILGLAGEIPAAVDPDHARDLVAATATSRMLALLGRHRIGFDPARDVVFDVLTQPKRHPNTVRFVASDREGAVVADGVWCSIGGGFILREEDAERPGEDGSPCPFPFSSASELLACTGRAGLSIAQVMHANEVATRPQAEVDGHVALIRDVMFSCIDRGLAQDGTLPGGLKVVRRARTLLGRLREIASTENVSPAHEVMDLVGIYAMAVNEENAAGGRVVTAPTNGAAGVLPAVMRYYRDHCRGATDQGLSAFLLTAAAVGALFKMNASISGAEVGCQGEVGVASAMAAAGLCAALGGTNAQIENAAEIAMEHHLGLTCDPVGGLVQIPCIERNAFGAVKAITAASLALLGDGSHRVSLDSVIATMRQTGADMQSKYKETSLGGLAVNVVDC